jgi:hypothetical protein
VCLLRGTGSIFKYNSGCIYEEEPQMITGSVDNWSGRPMIGNNAFLYRKLNLDYPAITALYTADTAINLIY